MPTRPRLSRSCSPAEVKVSTPASINTPIAPVVQLPTPQAQPSVTVQRPSEAKRFIIRTDIHYDAEKNLMTVMFELPGLKKSDLSPASYSKRCGGTSSWVESGYGTLILHSSQTL